MNNRNICQIFIHFQEANCAWNKWSKEQIKNHEHFLKVSGCLSWCICYCILGRLSYVITFILVASVIYLCHALFWGKSCSCYSPKNYRGWHIIKVDGTINEFENMKLDIDMPIQRFFPRSNKDFPFTVFEVLGLCFLETHHPNSLNNIVHTAAKGHLNPRKTPRCIGQRTILVLRAHHFS